MAAISEAQPASQVFIGEPSGNWVLRAVDGPLGSWTEAATLTESGVPVEMQPLTPPEVNAYGGRPRPYELVDSIWRIFR